MFTKYGEQARNVLNSLLDKYSECGIENIEEMSVLSAPPLPLYGTPIEIVKLFGSKEKFKQALRELENELYKNAA